MPRSIVAVDGSDYGVTAARTAMTLAQRCHFEDLALVHVVSLKPGQLGTPERPERPDLPEAEGILGFPGRQLCAILAQLGELAARAIVRVRSRAVYRALQRRDWDFGRQDAVEAAEGLALTRAIPQGIRKIDAATARG